MYDIILNLMYVCIQPCPQQKKSWSFWNSIIIIVQGSLEAGRSLWGQTLLSYVYMLHSSAIALLCNMYTYDNKVCPHRLLPASNDPWTIIIILFQKLHDFFCWGQGCIHTYIRFNIMSYMYTILCFRPCRDYKTQLMVYIYP